MQLLEFMKRDDIDDDTMAARINEGLPPEDHCTGKAVSKWKYREREPDAAKMQRMFEISNGEVTLEDWAKQPEKQS